MIGTLLINGLFVVSGTAFWCYVMAGVDFIFTKMYTKKIKDYLRCLKKETILYKLLDTHTKKDYTSDDKSINKIITVCVNVVHTSMLVIFTLLSVIGMVYMSINNMLILGVISSNGWIIINVYNGIKSDLYDPEIITLEEHLSDIKK